MHDSLTVNVCITVGEDCPMSYLIGADDQVELSCGSRRDGFDFVFAPVALRAFLALGAEALAELEALSAAEASDYQAEGRPTLALATAGERQS